MSRKRQKPAHRNSSRAAPLIGLIGLGLMGTAMSERLLRAGFRVVGWDIAPRQRAVFITLGGQPAARATDVFARCERVLLSLPQSKIVDAVLRDASGALRRGHIIADTSTGD